MIRAESARLQAARATILRPDLHADAVLREACAVLARHGDWIDHERARMLRAVLPADGPSLPPGGPARPRPWPVLRLVRGGGAPETAA